ncbi:MAG: hypothetical protein ABIJ09_27465 [Pseudomonadota bacterium]
MSTELKALGSSRATAGDELRTQDRLQVVVMAVAGVITVVFFVALYLAK